MLKSIVAKSLKIDSKLGSHVFLNVPVSVEEGVHSETFNPEKDDYYLSPEVIITTSRILAKMWLFNYLGLGPNGSHPRGYQLTSEEVHGIMLVCGMNATELTGALQLSKGQISKVLNNTQTLNSTAVRLLLHILKVELREPGYAKKFVKHEDLAVRHSEDDFDLKRA